MPIDIAKVQAICFDIDGTLSETDDLFVDRLARVLLPIKLVMIKFDTKKAARRIIMGMESPGNWIYSIPDRIGIDDEIASLMNKICYRMNHKSKFIIGEHIEELVCNISQKYPLAIVTVRGEWETNIFLESTGLRKYFSIIVHGTTCEHTKPYPDPLIFAAEQFHLKPDQLLMVGDTTVDIETAKRAGAQSIGVLSGFGEERELQQSGADLILEATVEMSALFNINPEGLG
jgi:phosphoglycolate phosphatase-like HAD superfamily hydrolase